MFRNAYDSDVSVWSPQGRLYQVEYAMEAVNQGSVTIGLKNRTHAILVALKRASSGLAAYQKKLMSIDTHCGISVSGLTADARLLAKYMRVRCLNYRYLHDTSLPITKLVSQVGSKMHSCTQMYNQRPYGVGFILAGYDDLGPHIYQVCPSGNNFDCKAMAIGARSQSARTYLELYLDDFIFCSLDELVRHGLRALCECLPNEVELNSKNSCVGVVSKDVDFACFEDDAIESYIQSFKRDLNREEQAAAVMYT